MRNQIENNDRMVSTIRYSMGYLPAVFLKTIIEDNIKMIEEEKKPATFSIKTCCLHIDISKLFENSSSKLNKNKSLSFNYSKNLYVPEYYYFFFNRFQEKLISCITNHGGDILFQGLGAYAIWPPQKSEDDEEIKEEIINIYLRVIQCALDLQKKALRSDFSNKTLFFPKIGISYGNCNFILLKTSDGKYEYTAYGDALLDAFDCSQKVSKKGQIITNRKMFEDISKYLDFNFIDEDSIYLSINSLKNTGNLQQINKSTVNIIRNNFSFEQIISKKNILTNFCNHLEIDNLLKSQIDEKWFKEIRYLTLLFVRIKMSQKDYENPEEIQNNFQIIYEISEKYGGIISKIFTDKDGFIYLIAFGIKKFKNSENEIRGVLASFEICKKLKQKKIIPYIGVTTGLSFYGLIGTLGGRREIFIISGLYFFGFLTMEKSETINEHKKDKFEDDNILIDEYTMIMIDYKIPSKFFKKLPTKIGIDINLFIPTKIESLINEHYVSNLFPLIGTHLHDKEDYEYEHNYELAKEDNIIFLEEETKRDIIKIIKEFALNKTKIKLINITGVSGCGKTLLLKKCLDSYFESNEKLKETLISNKTVKEYPFIFNANLTFVIHSDILINTNNKEDYRSLQLILKTMYDSIIKVEDVRKKTKKFFNQNKNLENYFKKIILFNNEENDKKELFNSFDNFDTDSFAQKKENKRKIHQLFINIIKDYKKIMNNAYRDILYEGNFYIPLIIIIDDINICDASTLEFIKYYLSHENNDFLLITANSIPLYPPYVYLEPERKDPFYDLQNNDSIAKFKVELLDTDEKKIIFVKSVLKELKGINITGISPNILKFLINKTFGGNPNILMRIILLIIEQNYYKIENEKLIETENFEWMLKYNDFTKMTLSRIIQKKVDEIINNNLDDEDICLLKFASLFGDFFELSQLKQVILIENTSIFIPYLKKGEDYYIYNKLKELESKYIIEIMEDLDLKNKYVVCKFSISFLREILYQRIPSDIRNQLHYIIGKMTKINFNSKYGKRSKYLSNEDELEMLKNHLKFSEITIHENFLKGSLSNPEMINDNLNINNLKTLLTQEICSKISSIKINDDKNNMIKAGFIYKKSDGKLTWENRYFVLTTNRVVYYYNEEDYNKEEIQPLGIFYLQNLFSVNLLTDGYVGGKKNIFSLSVNEWIKKGNYMTPRVYYLSIENREELYKWIITFNILKIKAFYDNYSQNFGYVNFPLYYSGKKENIFKPKKKTKFNYELYKELYKISKEKKLKSPKRRESKCCIFNRYFLRNDNDTKSEDDLKIIYMANGMLSKLKFFIRHSLPIFLSNIQISLKKSQDEFNEFNPNFSKEIIFKTPKFIISSKEIYLNEEIKLIEDRITNNKNREDDKKIQFSNQEKKYFNKFYNNIFHPKENKINFQRKNIKKYLEGKNVVKNKYKLFGSNTKKSNWKSEWVKYFEEDKNFFKDCQEEKIDTTDNLRYTDFIDKYDAYGNLKERTSFLFRQSISSKVPEKAVNESPILDTLKSMQKENDSEDIIKNESKNSEIEEDKDNDDIEKNKNLSKEDEKIEEKSNDKDKINNEKKEEKNIIEEKNSSEGINNINMQNKMSKSKNEKIKENKFDDSSEKEKTKKNNKTKKFTNLLDLVSDKIRNEIEKNVNSNKNGENSNIPDLAKEIKKSKDISNKNTGEKILNFDSKVSEDEKINENNLNINKDTTNSLFSFGDNNNKVLELNKNNQGNKSNEVKFSNSNNNQESSLVNSSKSFENDSNKYINSNNSKKSNDEKSISDENENNENNENDLLNLNMKSNEILSKKENERKASINTNEDKVKIIQNFNSKNIDIFDSEKMNDNNDINELKNNNLKKKFKSELKKQVNSKYDYLNELSPNRKNIINIKLNNLNKEKNKNVKKNNTTNEMQYNKLNTELDTFDKLREINFSLDNEKSLSTYFKRINKENAINNLLKENSRNKSRKSTNNTQEMSFQSTNSNFDNIFYPNVYYINEEENLHTKTHVSMLFTNLKYQNNIYNQEEIN